VKKRISKDTIVLKITNPTLKKGFMSFNGRRISFIPANTFVLIDFSSRCGHEEILGNLVGLSPFLDIKTYVKQ